MRTKSLLANATATNAAEALNVARAAGWTDASIMRHASRHVLALVNPVLVEGAKPKRKRGRVREPQAQYAAPALVAERFPVVCERNNLRHYCFFDIGAARQRKHGTGTTHNVTAEVPGGFETFTMSPNSVSKLLAGKSVWLGIGGGMYQTTKVS